MHRSAHRLVEAKWFDPLMLGVIALNAVVLGLETYDDIDREHGGTLDLINDVILGVFVLELLLRHGRGRASGPGVFFRSGWNVFDFLVVAASFTPGVRENATMLRLARLLRITRAVRLLPDLRVLDGGRRPLDPRRRQPRRHHRPARLRLRHGRLADLRRTSGPPRATTPTSARR